MFSLICAWINGWVNNREAGNLRRHRAHYNVPAMGRHASVPRCKCDGVDAFHHRFKSLNFWHWPKLPEWFNDAFMIFVETFFNQSFGNEYGIFSVRPRWNTNNLNFNQSWNHSSQWPVCDLCLSYVCISTAGLCTISQYVFWHIFGLFRSLRVIQRLGISEAKLNKQRTLESPDTRYATQYGLQIYGGMWTPIFDENVEQGWIW